MTRTNRSGKESERDRGTSSNNENEHALLEEASAAQVQHPSSVEEKAPMSGDTEHNEQEQDEDEDEDSIDDEEIENNRNGLFLNPSTNIYEPDQSGERARWIEPGDRPSIEEARVRIRRMVFYLQGLLEALFSEGTSRGVRPIYPVSRICCSLLTGVKQVSAIPSQNVQNRTAQPPASDAPQRPVSTGVYDEQSTDRGASAIDTPASGEGNEGTRKRRRAPTSSRSSPQAESGTTTTTNTGTRSTGGGGQQTRRRLRRSSNAVNSRTTNNPAAAVAQTQEAVNENINRAVEVAFEARAARARQRELQSTAQIGLNPGGSVETAPWSLAVPAAPAPNDLVSLSIGSLNELIRNAVNVALDARDVRNRHNDNGASASGARGVPLHTPLHITQSGIPPPNPITSHQNPNSIGNQAWYQVVPSQYHTFYPGPPPPANNYHVYPTGPYQPPYNQSVSGFMPSASSAPSVGGANVFSTTSSTGNIHTVGGNPDSHVSTPARNVVFTSFPPSVGTGSSTENVRLSDIAQPISHTPVGDVGDIDTGSSAGSARPAGSSQPVNQLTPVNATGAAGPGPSSGTALAMGAVVLPASFQGNPARFIATTTRATAVPPDSSRSSSNNRTGGNPRPTVPAVSSTSNTSITPTAPTTGTTRASAAISVTNTPSAARVTTAAPSVRAGNRTAVNAGHTPRYLATWDEAQETYLINLSAEEDTNWDIIYARFSAQFPQHGRNKHALQQRLHYLKSHPRKRDASMTTGTGSSAGRATAAPTAMGPPPRPTTTTATAASAIQGTVGAGALPSGGTGVLPGSAARITNTADVGRNIGTTTDTTPIPASSTTTTTQNDNGSVRPGTSRATRRSTAAAASSSRAAPASGRTLRSSTNRGSAHGTNDENNENDSDEDDDEHDDGDSGDDEL